MGAGYATILAAPFVGSFLGVLIARLPAGRPVALTRSACDSCGHELGAADLIPVVSYAVRRGRCRYCGAPIGLFHPAVEVAALLVALWAGHVDGADADGGILLWADCILGWGLLALAWVDARHMVLPDLLTLPLLLAGLGFAFFLNPLAVLPHAVGAAVGYIAFRLIAWLYRRLRGRDGLGQGDAKLLAAAGAWVTWVGLGQVVLLAALFGLALAFLFHLRGKAVTMTTALPFGFCLALATWIVWLYRFAPYF